MLNVSDGGDAAIFESAGATLAQTPSAISTARKPLLSDRPVSATRKNRRLLGVWGTCRVFVEPTPCQLKIVAPVVSTFEPNPAMSEPKASGAFTAPGVVEVFCMPSVGA